MHSYYTSKGGEASVFVIIIAFVKRAIESFPNNPSRAAHIA